MNRAIAAGRRLDRPVVAGVLAAIIAGAIVAILAIASQHGVGALVHAAPPYTDASAPRSLPVLATDRGFDGQFYYRMAVSPLSTANRVAGVRFDIPALRNQRVGYSVLARIAALGDRNQIPKALVAVNVLAMFALGWIAGVLAQEYRRHACWGLVIVCYPGFVYSLGFDLGEIVATALVAGAVLALQRRHLAVAALLTSGAVLTRETATILAIAVVAAALWQLGQLREADADDNAASDARRASAGLAVAGLVPLGVLAAWQLWLRAAWGTFPLSASADKNVRFPFQGLVDAIDKFLPPDSGAVLFRDVSLAFLLFVIVVACLSLRGSGAALFVKIAFVLGVVLLPLLSASPWAGATSFMRAATEAFFFAILVILGHPYRVRAQQLVAAATFGVFALTFASEVSKARP